MGRGWPWERTSRRLARALAIIPPAIVAVLHGERGTAQLLILRQVVPSLQLSFAVIPLVRFTSDRFKMGESRIPGGSLRSRGWSP